jgi:3-dehydroquinate dehydratase I
MKGFALLRNNRRSMFASSTQRQMEKRLHPERSNVVGVVHTLGGFAEAANTALDAVEVRVDAFPQCPSLHEVAALQVPAILTVRRLDEGGVKPMSEDEQLALYRGLIPAVAAIDIEIRATARLLPILEIVRREKKALIISFHDFESTPSLARLRALSARARAEGADIVKIAAKTETPAEVARLLVLLQEARGPLSVMGMGSLGRASRLLFAKSGSALNYGWLDRPQVPGQWSAKEFLELLARA